MSGILVGDAVDEVESVRATILYDSELLTAFNADWFLVDSDKNVLTIDDWQGT